MDIQKTIRYLQSNVDKRGVKIKSLWDIQNSYEEYRKQAITEAPDRVGYWRDCKRFNMKSIDTLTKQQKLEKKMLFHFICYANCKRWVEDNV